MSFTYNAAHFPNFEVSVCMTCSHYSTIHYSGQESSGWGI